MIKKLIEYLTNIIDKPYSNKSNEKTNPITINAKILFIDK